MKRTPNEIRPKALVRAIEGTGGVIQTIADRLDTTRGVIRVLLKKEGPAWDFVREVYEEECERVGDLAENTVKELMQQRIDLPSALRAATWYLQRKHKDRGYSERTELTLKGGDTPIQISSTNVLLQPDDLENIPLELRKQLLATLQPSEEENEKGGE